MNRWFGFLFVLLICVSATWADEPERQSARIDVILWFDTEDYILPASDDAAMRLANWLTAQKIQATFKVVGEKARILEKRGRTDVIEALKKHEIGYHSNWHSVPPTPAQYLDACGWADGVAEFTRREKPGYDDVARIFGQKPTCYGQPGSSWGPQSHAALHNWGMKIYLDAGNHVNVDGKPFWYGGLLNFYKLTHQIRVGLSHANELEDARIKFLRARDQLIAEGGGVISIVYHPCEFVHKEFWDGVNFKHGANPPREQWKLPPVKTEAESKLAYRNFEEYVLFMKRFPEVRFVTATQAARAYPDRAQQSHWSYLEVEALAVKNAQDFRVKGIQWVKHKEGTLSPAEIFWLCTMACHQRIDYSRATTLEVIVSQALPALIQGPGRVPAKCESPRTFRFGDDELLRATDDVKKYLEQHHEVPPEIWIGSKAITPEYFLMAMVQYLELQPEVRRKKNYEVTTILSEPVLATKKYIADDSANLWKWVIFPPGFSAPNVMAHAKRQAWTLKPAIRFDNAASLKTK